MLNRQTEGNLLQGVTAEDAAECFACNVRQLRYVAWPQEVDVEGETVLITAEAWVKSPNPNGGIRSGDSPLPALVFVSGEIQGVAVDIGLMEELITRDGCAHVLNTKRVLNQSAIAEIA